MSDISSFRKIKNKNHFHKDRPAADSPGELPVHLPIKLKDRDKKIPRLCGLCNRPFTTSGKHTLFCDRCKHNNDTYRFAEWLAG